MLNFDSNHATNTFLPLIIAPALACAGQIEVLERGAPCLLHLAVAARLSKLSRRQVARQLVEGRGHKLQRVLERDAACKCTKNYEFV